MFVMGGELGGQLSNSSYPGWIWIVVRIRVTGDRGARIPVRSTLGEQALPRVEVGRGLTIGLDQASPKTVLAHCCCHQAPNGYQYPFHGLITLVLRLLRITLRSCDRSAAIRSVLLPA